MKRWIGMLLLAGLLALASGLLHLAWQQPEKMPAGDSGAALGLILVERENAEGLYVLAVTKDSPAGQAGIQPGDTLLRAMDTPLQTSEALDILIDAGPEKLLLTLNREGQELQLILPVRSTLK